MILVALPLLGIIFAGRDPAAYLEIPPTTRYVRQAGFSWPWFAFFTVADLLLMAGLLWAVRCGHRKKPGTPEGSASPGAFPWWGWAGLALCLSNWLLAWQRFSWFWLFQPHTFLPIWAGFILAVNALAVKRSGSCLLLRRPLRFVLLFPASAGFWWFFEYLNRFVQNWYYTGIEGMGPGAYSYFSSLAFATVLPGVLSMIDLLSTVPALGRGLARCRPIRLPPPRWVAPATLAAAGAGLALIGRFPDQLFALLWVSPLLIFLAIQALTGRRTLLQPLRSGDWRPVVIPALAALACGFFWEMWNYFSLARWTYSIPHVQRFHLFEMPILGYGGYLPFGLACLAAGMPVIGDPFNQADRY
ncbi:hypothetical protein [Desulfosarcina alkanivorans]|uniref:hypothetical protein n=1 Tax=Desulfosarcina alkanivorans TaxID=571177 RepID=UPI0012D36643|nr:hypothetical protein [Desulfosarcina alkanivorans]